MLKPVFYRALFVALVIFFGFVTLVQASVSIHVNKNSQTMNVSIDGVPTYNWAVSTGAAGHGTPNGTFRPQRMYKHYHSKKYNSPMPHSIFYRGGYAIHATYQTGRLGTVASKGCVRLAPANAAALYALVQQHGARDTQITITGASVKKVYKKKRYKNRNKIRYAAL